MPLESPATIRGIRARCRHVYLYWGDMGPKVWEMPHGWGTPGHKECVLPRGLGVEGHKVCVLPHGLGVQMGAGWFWQRFWGSGGKWGEQSIGF
jgi:hypothetical protein